MRRFVNGYFPFCVTLLLVGVSVLQVYYFAVNDWDYSYFLHAPWSFIHGLGLVAPFAEATGEMPFYTHHCVPLLMTLGPVMALFPSSYTLAVVHGLAVGACFFLVPRLVQIVFEDIGKKDYLPTACLLQLGFLFYRPFLAAWRYESHMTTLVTPFIFLALILLHRKKMGWATFCCVVVALGQERSSVAVAGIGMYAYLLLRLRVYALALCSFSVVYFLGAVKVVLPMLRESLGGTADYAFTNAIKPEQDIYLKLKYVGKQVFYACLLPLAGKKALMAAACALPVMGIALISQRQAMYSFFHHYQDLTTPFFVASAAYGLGWIYDALRENKYMKNKTICAEKAVGLVCGVLLCIQVATMSSYTPFKVLYSLVTSEKRDSLAQLNHTIQPILRLDPSIHVYAQSGIGPRVTLRPYHYTVHPDVFQKLFVNSVVVLSPLVGDYYMGDHAEALHQLKANPTLTVVFDNGDLQILASRDMPESVIQTLRGTSR